VTAGVVEMACRLNNDAASFEKAATNLKRTAQIEMSAEQLRQLVQAEGRRVLAAQQNDTIPPAFTAADCVVPGDRQRTRIYTGVDGVMVPIITDAEKRKRRENVVRKRRSAERAGKRLRPLPPRRIGADQSFKEFKTITFYDETNDHRHIVLSRSKRTQVGSILRREGGRLKFREADERIANVDGASWIPPQLEDAELRLNGVGLDFYHLSENIHKARRHVYGEENDDGVAGRPARRQASRRREAVVLRDRTAEHDQLPGVRGEGLADRLWSDGSPLQNQHGTLETLRPTLGPTFGRTSRGSRQSSRQRPMGGLLDNSNRPKMLSTPRSLVPPLTPSARRACDAALRALPSASSCRG
jgi:hypothetical protein